MKTLLMIVALAAAACTACGSAPQVSTLPTTGSSTTSTTPVPSSSTPVDRPPAALSALKPCDVLTDAQVGMYGYTGKRSFDDGTTHTCTYTQPGSSRQLVISFANTSIRTLDHDQGDTVTSEQIGKHPAVRVQSADSPMCSYFLDIEGTQLVTVQAIGQASSGQACTHGLSVARLVEPSLP